MMWRSVRAMGLAGVLVAVTACGSDDAKPAPVTLAPASMLPAFVRGAPTVVQDAYRFALANPEVLDLIPCYCGCGGMGHTSNLGCYVKEFRSDGSVVFDDHAFG